MTDTPEALALKPCPICGRMPMVNKGNTASFILCTNGHRVEVEAPTMAEAIAAWNTRTTRPADDLVRQLVEAGKRLVSGVKARHPGEELRCPDMIALDSILQAQESTNAS